MKIISDEYISLKKDHIKYDILFIVENIRKKIKSKTFNDKKLKKYFISRLSTVRLDNNNYLFVFRQNKKNKKIKIILNPNIPSQEGKSFHIEYFKDIDGNFFMKDMLAKINLKNGIFSKYKYKEFDSDKVKDKLSYIYYIKELDWYIGTGLYLDKIEKFIKNKEDSINKEYKDSLIEFIIFILLITSIISILLILYIRYIYSIQSQLNKHNIILEEIQKKVNIGFYTYNKKSGKKNFSKELLNILEISKGDLKENIDSLITFVELSEQEKVKKILNNLNINNDEFRIIVNGKIKYIKYSIKIIEKDDTEIIRIFMDNTYNKNLELNQIKNRLLYRNEIKNIEFTDFLNMLSHQWREPIALVNSKLIDLYDEDFNKEKFILDIEDITLSLSNTIDNFLSLYSNNSKNEYFVIKDIINNTLKIFDIKFFNITFNIKSNNSKQTLNNPSIFQELLIILFTNSYNAFKINNTLNPTIDILIDEKNKIIIQDNAGGIKEKYLPNIFDIYFTTKSKNKKNGLGLYIAKILVENKLKGTISLVNKLNGIEVTIKI